MIFNQGYSYRTKQLARERIEKLKQQNQQEIIIRKQKIKELSKQTNELRKKIKDKTQTLQDDEEERRATILENRKLKQKLATEQFQRIQDKRAKIRKSAPKNDLKNGLYHVNGHVIEIKDGVRVNSMKKDETHTTNKILQPSQHNQSYAPNTYLSNHLNELIKTDLSLETKNNYLNKNQNGDFSQNDSGIIKFGQPLISDVLDDIRYDAGLAQRKIIDAEEHESESDECSLADSLEDTGQEEKMPKSNLKGISRNGLNDSAHRKVTFSDSIEFNDGNIGRLEIAPVERVPLYQRIENQMKENAKNATKDDKGNEDKGNDSKPPTYSAEEVLDQLREEALMTTFPEVSYPESVSVALEQLSQSKRIEKETSNETDLEVEEIQPNDFGNLNDSFKNNAIRLGNLHHERTDTCGKSNVTPMEDTEMVTHHIVNENSHSQSGNVSPPIIQKDTINARHTNGFEVAMDGQRTSHSSMPVSTISHIHTSTLPISKHNPHRHEHVYAFNNTAPIMKSENEVQSLPSTSLSHHTSSLSYTSVTSSYTSMTSFHTPKPPPRKNENQRDEPSAVLYVPQYPYFPSKEQRYSTNGTYDGRLPINYYESQYKNNYSPPVSQHMNGVNSSRVSLNTNGSRVSVTNGYHTAYTSEAFPTQAKKNVRDGDNDSDDVTRELRLSYINITACDISSRSDKRSKSDEIYKEVERTLADITFSKSGKKSITQNPDYYNEPSEHLENKDINDSPVKKVDSSEARVEESKGPSLNESKISNAIKCGTAIPVRMHSVNSTHDNGPTRRGRVIVSADKKRRQANNIGSMLPHPPDKPKTNTISNGEKNQKILASKKAVSRDEKPLSRTDISNDNENCKPRDKHLMNNQGDMNDEISKVVSRRTPSKTNHEYIYDHHGSKNGSNSIENYADFNNNYNNALHSSPTPNNHPKSYVRVPPNALPWNKPMNKNSQIPLDKTPTDEEINKLWTNVRECIYNEQTEHAYSDSNYVMDNRYRKQYRRTLSGSSIHRKSDDRSTPRIFTNYSPVVGSGMNRRYGSYDSLNRQLASDSFSHVFNKPALLPQRATKVIRNSNSSHENKYTVFKGNGNLNNGYRTYQHETQSAKYGDVTSSMASFLVLEELCKKQSLTPRQAEAVFQASNSIQKKLDKEKAGISALSMEERCVMESIDRINERLKERGYRVGADARVVTAKPPLPDQRRRMYPTT